MTGDRNTVKFLTESTSRIDLNVLAILLFVAPLSLLQLSLKTALLLILAIPQIRIWTHVAGYYADQQRSSRSYIFVNQIVLFLLVALSWAMGPLLK